jgi:PAS domain S-box-containing protein
MATQPPPALTLANEHAYWIVNEACGERALQAQEAHFVPDVTLLEEAIENSLDCIAVVDMRGTVLYMNLPGACLLGLEAPLSSQGISWPELWSGECADMAEYSIESARSGRPCRFTARRHSIQGSEKWWDIAVTPVLDQYGNPVQMLCIARDVTELKKSVLESKQTLLTEVNHRIKNSLTAVAGLLSMQARRARDENVRVSLHQARSRVMAVAEVHRHLYDANRSETVDIGDCIAAVVRESVAMLRGERNVRLQLACPHGTAVHADRATTLALVATELVTNSMKHAFPSSDGILHVGLYTSSAHLFLHVDDDGRGLPESFDAVKDAGVGMKVVLRLVHQLHGELKIERLARGAHFRVFVPRHETATLPRT